MKSKVLLAATLLICIVVFQHSPVNAQIPTDSWRDHLPYNHGTQVAFAENKIYCATESALFYYNTDDHSVNRKTRINGMSDVGISSIAYSSNDKMLVVGYTNGNIDLIGEENILNIPDIKNKSILGGKEIHNISIFDDFAYLACDFGIVVLNLPKQEVADTYIIGPNSSSMKINYVGKLKDELIALTEYGIYKADANNEFLSYYKNWTLDTNVNHYNTEFIDGTIVFDKLIAGNNNSSNYTINSYNGDVWTSEFDKNAKITSISSSNNLLIITDNAGSKSYNEEMITENSAIKTELSYSLIDKENVFWSAHKNSGLMRFEGIAVDSIYPDGPVNNGAFAMENNHDEVLIALGGYEGTGENTWNPAEYYHFGDEYWTNFTNAKYDDLDPLRDVCTFAGTGTKGQYYVGTWGYGVIEMVDGEIKTIYDENNTDGAVLTIPNGYYGGISGMDLDKKGNLWLLQRNSANPFLVKSTDGQWYNYEYNQNLSIKKTRELINTSNDDFWAVSAIGDGILVFNTNGTPADKSDDVYKKIKPADSGGNTIDGDIAAIVQDQEGAIWLGTADGIAVYDYPQNVLADKDVYARKPKVVIDGYEVPLLEGAKISAIAVDGGNRKWIGTAGGGLFLVSPDGTEQIMNLNMTNSPLFSDNILSLSINPVNGELYIGTDKGVLSYMSSSSEGESSLSNIYAFPNPVREGYSGLITIRGLMYETNVKITDIAGNIVYEAVSNGGDLVWNGLDMSGQKVHTGVYLVMAANSDGTVAEVSKILFVR